MTGRRKYNEGCAVAHGLDLVGERWALLVVRELVLGPKRFTDLQDGLPGASPVVLTQRLKELTAAGITQRRRLPPPAASWVYELTEWGAELGPVLVGLARWSSRSPAMAYDAPLSTDSVLLSLITLFDADTSADFEATVDIVLGRQRCRLTIADRRLSLTRDGDSSPADIVLDTDQDTLLTLLRTDTPLHEIIDNGALRLVGDPDIAERFRSLFPLPDPVSAGEPKGSTTR